MQFHSRKETHEIYQYQCILLFITKHLSTVIPAFSRHGTRCAARLFSSAKNRHAPLFVVACIEPEHNALLHNKENPSFFVNGIELSAQAGGYTARVFSPAFAPSRAALILSDDIGTFRGLAEGSGVLFRQLPTVWIQGIVSHRIHLGVEEGRNAFLQVGKVVVGQPAFEITFSRTKTMRGKRGR